MYKWIVKQIENLEGEQDAILSYLEFIGNGYHGLKTTRKEIREMHKTLDRIEFKLNILNGIRDYIS